MRYVRSLIEIEEMKLNFFTYVIFLCILFSYVHIYHDHIHIITVKHVCYFDTLCL